MEKKEELEQQGFKSYENDAICVFWNPKMCQHADRVCTRTEIIDKVWGLILIFSIRMSRVDSKKAIFPTYISKNW